MTTIIMLIDWMENHEKNQFIINATAYQHRSADRDAWAAIDGNITTAYECANYWVESDHKDKWVQFAFDKVRTVVEVRMRVDENGKDKKDWRYIEFDVG